MHDAVGDGFVLCHVGDEEGFSVSSVFGRVGLEPMALVVDYDEVET